jgi:hypothetical protein
VTLPGPHRRRWRTASLLASVASPAVAATEAGAGWLPWFVIGAIALFVIGIVLRMILAARFPKGYRGWAARRRERFEENNEAWDRADEEFRR